MPDFHQPDDRDRQAAASDVEGDTGDWAGRVPLEDLRAEAVAAGIADAQSLDRDELESALRSTRPSSRNDPNRPDRPLT